MLIDIDIIKKCLHHFNISVSGVLHLGAHECEELIF